VVDASVVIKWFIDEVHAEAARRLQAEHYDLLAPDVLWPESGNILWKKVRRGELTTAEARLIFGADDGVQQLRGSVRRNLRHRGDKVKVHRSIGTTDPEVTNQCLCYTVPCAGVHERRLFPFPSVA
jgi:hypothetical protein